MYSCFVTNDSFPCVPDERCGFSGASIKFSKLSLLLPAFPMDPEDTLDVCELRDAHKVHW